MSLERQVRIVAGVATGAGGVLALFVDPLFAALPAFIGAGLAIAGTLRLRAAGQAARLAAAAGEPTRAGSTGTGTTRAGPAGSD